MLISLFRTPFTTGGKGDGKLIDFSLPPTLNAKIFHAVTLPTRASRANTNTSLSKYKSVVRPCFTASREVRILIQSHLPQDEGVRERRLSQRIIAA